MTRFFAAVHRLLCASSLGVITTFLVCTPAPAQATWTASDGYTAFDAYNSAFYFNFYGKAGGPLTDGHGYLQHEGNWDSTANPDTGFWRWAEQIEMTEDAYKNAVAHNSSEAASYKSMITQLCDGFIDKYGDDWSSNTWNDDLEWATMAFDRAYEITGNTRYHNDATSNLGVVWTRGHTTYTDPNTQVSYTAIYENSNHNQFAAVSNFTFVIAAELLRKDQTDPNAGWQNEANDVMTFAINNLWNTSTGQVYNSLDYSCSTTCAWRANTTNRSYNFGVAIGALVWHETWSNGNPVGGYNDKAQLIATYLATQLSPNVNPPNTPPNDCSNGTPSNTRYYSQNAAGYSYILPIYCSYNSDAAGFNAIALRWVGYALSMSTFNDNNATLQWAQKNVSQGWSNIYNGTQTNSKYLSWNDWIDPTPASTSTAPLYSWDCSDLVVGMMDIAN